MNVPYLQYVYGGKSPDRNGLSHSTIAPYGVFNCSDGKQALISIQNEQEWARFCDMILGDAAIASDRRFSNNSARVANRPVIDALIGQSFAAISNDMVAQMLEQAGIANGRLKTPWRI